MCICALCVRYGLLDVISCTLSCTVYHDIPHMQYTTPPPTPPTTYTHLKCKGTCPHTGRWHRQWCGLSRSKHPLTQRSSHHGVGCMEMHDGLLVEVYQPLGSLKQAQETCSWFCMAVCRLGRRKQKGGGVVVGATEMGVEDSSKCIALNGVT